MTYNIKLVSLANSAIFVILILTFWLTLGIIFIPPQGFPDSNSSLLFIPVIFYITYLLWQKFVTGRTAWTIDDNEIKITWTKNFFLNRCYDMTLKWSDIKDINRGLDPTYYILRIIHVSGYKKIFIHDPTVTKDDFREMLKLIYEKFYTKNNYKH